MKLTINDLKRILELWKILDFFHYKGHSCRKPKDELYDDCIITSGIKDEQVCYGQLLDKNMKPFKK